MKAVFDPEYIRRINGPNVKDKGTKMDKAEMLMDDIEQFRKKHNCSRLVMIWCGSTEVYPQARRGASDAEGFRVRADEERSRRSRPARFTRTRR